MSFLSFQVATDMGGTRPRDALVNLDHVIEVQRMNGVVTVIVANGATPRALTVMPADADAVWHAASSMTFTPPSGA